MATDDAAARKARANRLRRQIAQIAHPETNSSEDQEGASQQKKDESPRDFIHRRMRELNKPKRSKSSSK